MPRSGSPNSNKPGDDDGEKSSEPNDPFQVATSLPSDYLSEFSESLFKSLKTSLDDSLSASLSEKNYNLDHQNVIKEAHSHLSNLCRLIERSVCSHTIGSFYNGIPASPSSSSQLHSVSSTRLVMD